MLIPKNKSIIIFFVIFSNAFNYLFIYNIKYRVSNIIIQTEVYIQFSNL